MNEVSGYGQAGRVQPDDGTGRNASEVTTNSNAFGLEAYTGSPMGTVDQTESTQRDDQKQTTWTDLQVESLWQARLGEPVVGGPAALDGTLIITGRSGRIYAFNATDGTERWQSEENYGRTTQPAVKNGLAFVGNQNGKLRAIDAAAGTVRWSYDVDGEIEAQPVAQDDLVHVAGSGGQVHLIDSESGDRQAAFGHGNPAVCSLAVGRETVLLGSAGGGLQARCTTDGRERWRCLPEKAVVAAPTTVDNRAYVATIDDVYVLAIDRVTGAIRQRFEVGSAVWGRPVVTDDIIVVASQDGVVTAFDREAGTRRWRVELCGSAWCGPAVDNGRVYIADDIGRTYALDASDGEEWWRFDADAAITTAPTVADGFVFVATEAGSVYALTETRS